MAKIESLEQLYHNLEQKIADLDRGAIFIPSESSSLASIVLSSSGSAYYSTTYQYTKAYDGSLDRNTGRYASLMNSACWMQLHLDQEYKVSTVSVITISDWYYARPTNVKVCKSSAGVNCVSCGGDWIGERPSGGSTQFWAYVQCPSGTSGNYIYLESTSHMTFDEMKFSS
jgi:hypothetical protein